MDSGNSSGSMQSSSGGDEEYDSRPDHSSSVLPSFLNQNVITTSHFNPQPSFLPHQQQQQQQHPTFFDPSSNLFQPFSQSPPPNPNLNFLNLDVVRSRGLQSDHRYPSCTDHLRNTFPGSSSSSQSNLAAQASSLQVSSMQLRSLQDNGARASSQSSDLETHHQHHVAAATTRNPKKRTRASRRAPTTVLTTDTSNFRAMVQEFTGIPAPPFSGSPYTRRLDLFGGGGGSPMGSMMYPLRPSAQKVHLQTPFASSSLPSSSSSSPSFLNNMVDATNMASTTGTAIATAVSDAVSRAFNPPSSINYQLGSDHLGLPNQMLSFQSLLQPSPILPPLNVSGLGAKSQPNLPLTSLDELGGDVNANLGVGGFPSHVTTEGMRRRVNENDRWRSPPSDGDQDHHLRTSFDGNNSQRINITSKLNYSAHSSSSEFHHHERGLDNVSRGEGTVDSWICPGD